MLHKFKLSEQHHGFNLLPRKAAVMSAAALGCLFRVLVKETSSGRCCRRWARVAALVNAEHLSNSLEFMSLLFESNFVQSEWLIGLIGLGSGSY